MLVSAPAPFLLLCGGGEERGLRNRLDCARSAEFETSSLVELSSSCNVINIINNVWSLLGQPVLRSLIAF